MPPPPPRSLSLPAGRHHTRSEASEGGGGYRWGARQLKRGDEREVFGWCGRLRRRRRRRLRRRGSASGPTWREAAPERDRPLSLGGDGDRLRLLVGDGADEGGGC